MQQIKLFVSPESEIGSMEENVNAWLRENDAEIVHVFGNIAPQTPAYVATKAEQTGRRFHPSDVFLAIVYRKA
ncbi:MAG: hypothetical protein IH985_03555 [Planctomycetes bacterium]|nr:hypothetical protein [Planctomycetota bacterium]